MNQLNRTAQLIMLLLVLIYVAGFFIVPSWISYLAGSFIMYMMCSVVLNKLKSEVKEMQGNQVIGDKPKGQWEKEILKRL